MKRTYQPSVWYLVMGSAHGCLPLVVAGYCGHVVQRVARVFRLDAARPAEDTERCLNSVHVSAPGFFAGQKPRSKALARGLVIRYRRESDIWRGLTASKNRECCVQEPR